MEKFIDLLSTINQWYWFGFGLVLIILEVILGVNFFLLWIGLSAASIGVIVLIYPQLAWEYQFIIFALESTICLYIWNLQLKKLNATEDTIKLNRRNEQYIGRVVTLKEPIVNGRGRVHIDDSFWRVEGADLPAGTAIEIVDVDGVVLKIKKHET